MVLSKTTLAAFIPWRGVASGFVQQLAVGGTTFFALAAASIVARGQLANSDDIGLLGLFLIAICCLLIVAYIAGLVTYLFLRQREIAVWEQVVQAEILQPHASTSIKFLADTLNTEFRDIVQEFGQEFVGTFEMTLSLLISLVLIGSFSNLAVVGNIAFSIVIGVVVSLIISNYIATNSAHFSQERVSIIAQTRQGLRAQRPTLDLRRWRQANYALEIGQALPGIAMIVAFTIGFVLILILGLNNQPTQLFALVVIMPRIIQMLAFSRDLLEKRSKFIELSARLSVVKMA